MGGLLCQLVLLARYRKSEDLRERVGAERCAGSILTLIQKPGIYLSIVTGVVLVWLIDPDLLDQGWLQFKILFVFWIALATRSDVSQRYSHLDLERSVRQPGQRSPQLAESKP